MKFLLFPQILHDGEVHCMAASNDSTVLVTGGKDNIINLWNLGELLDVSKLQDDSSSEARAKIEQVQPIQQIKCQEPFINNIKWVPNSYNKFISTTSSGSVYFHEISFDGKVENRKIYPVQEQSSDLESVVDVSVSLDGRLVAWSTSDGKLYVYDLHRNTFQELTLTAKDNLTIQRSIAFNCVTNYLITIGDDTQINVFQYEYDSITQLYKFRLINKISKLFGKNPLNVRYKRVSWSPDGELISIPTASKNQTSLISLLSSSQNWNTTASLVGHDLTCEVAKFGHHIFSENSNETTNLYNVIASGGSDGTIAIWNTSKTSPIMVLKHVVDAQIYDIVWTNSSNVLFCTSKGSLGILRFYPDELGYAVSGLEMKRLNDISIKSMKPMNYRYEYEQVSGNRKTLPPIEFVDQATAINSTSNTEEAHRESKTEVADAQRSSGEEIGPTTKGEITPEVIDPTVPMEDSSVTAKKEVASKPSPKLAAAGKKPNSPAPSTMQPNLSKQKVTTKDGKRRIQPMLISNNGTSAAQASKIGQPEPVPINGEKGAMEFDPPSYSVSEEFNRSKRTRAEEPNGNGAVKKTKREMEPVKFIGSVIVNPNISFAKARLPTPKIRFGFQLKSKAGDDLFTLDIKNGSGNEVKPSRITYFKRDKEIWCDFVPKFVQLACEGSNFWAVSTADGEILTYSHISGKKLLPPLVLGAPISFLESQGKFLMAVTCVGELNVWNLETKKIELKTSIAALLELGSKLQEGGLTKSDYITLCAITSLGIPLVTCSNGSGYLYNKDLGIWQIITESWWAFGSHYWDSVDDGKNKNLQSLNMFDEEESIIQLLEQKTNEEIIRKTRSGRAKLYNKISKNMIMKEGYESLENTISISHLENRILCCELLGENRDFHQYFRIYIQRICELGYKAKLYEVCDELLGPIDEESKESKEGDANSESKWNPKICGINKRELLKETIDLCSQYRDSQRVLYHFSKKLGLVDQE